MRDANASLKEKRKKYGAINKTKKYESTNLKNKIRKLQPENIKLLEPETVKTKTKNMTDTEMNEDCFENDSNRKETICNNNEEQDIQKDKINTHDGSDKEKKTNEDTYQNNKYKPGDRGPYYIIIEKKGIEDIVIAELLNSLNFGAILNIKQYGKNRVRVQTREMDTANKILKNVDLKKIHQYNSYIPNFLLETIGYINKIPINTNLENLKNNIKGDATVTKVERITRWNNMEQKSEPTPAIKVTFRSNTLPRDIAIYDVKRKVTFYIPKPMLCKKCLVYGHTQKNCRGQQKCVNCAETDHTKQGCKNQTKCHYCGENHVTNSSICNEFKRQKKIKYLMVTKKISYGEARQFITPPEFKVNEEEFPRLIKNQKNEIQQIKEEMNQIKLKLTADNTKLQNEVAAIKTQMTEINNLNRTIQATTHGYLNLSANDPKNDLVLTEIIQLLGNMDKLITKNYKTTHNISQNE